MECIIKIAHRPRVGEINVYIEYSLSEISEIRCASERVVFQISRLSNLAFSCGFPALPVGTFWIQVFRLVMSNLPTTVAF